MNRNDAIAIVGLSCRLPGATGPEAFWRLLCDGGHAITEVPLGRWETGVLAEAGARYGGFIDGIDHFDAGFFGVSAAEAAAMDPQQRLMLELAWEAMEDAGSFRRRCAASRSTCSSASARRITPSSSTSKASRR